MCTFLYISTGVMVHLLNFPGASGDLHDLCSKMSKTDLQKAQLPAETVPTAHWIQLWPNQVKDWLRDGEPPPDHVELCEVQKVETKFDEVRILTQAFFRSKLGGLTESRNG